MVILDEEGTIVDLDTTIERIGYRRDEVIGKNWFDIFIDQADRAKIYRVFRTILEREDHNYTTYKNDILCKDGSHLFIDFYNRLVTLPDSRRYTFSLGLEHLEADPTTLKTLAREIYEAHPLFR